jgi:hypothetical protein
VHCVIVGFGLQDVAEKTLFEYDPDIKGEPHAIKAANINPYLVDAPDVVLPRRSSRFAPCRKSASATNPSTAETICSRRRKGGIPCQGTRSGSLFPALAGADEFINGYRALVPLAGRLPAGKAARHAGRRCSACRR